MNSLRVELSRRDASSVRKARIRDDEVRRKMRRQLNGSKGGGEALLGTSSAEEYGTEDPNVLKAQIGTPLLPIC
jgi:hypothetical protein